MYFLIVRFAELCDAAQEHAGGLGILPPATDYSGTVCPRSSDPIYIVTYYIKWVTASWTDGSLPPPLRRCSVVCLKVIDYLLIFQF